MTQQERFVLDFYCLAKEVEKRYGVPYLAALGQGALESAWGKSAPHNNFFGIKAFSNWKGDKHFIMTKDIINGQEVYHKQWFRSYPTPRDSWMDYGYYLKNSGLYKAAFQETNPYNFVAKVGPIYAWSGYHPVAWQVMQKIQTILTTHKPPACGIIPVIPIALALGVGVWAAYGFPLPKNR